MPDRTAVRITTAPTSRTDDIAARQRRYAISMAITTVCVIGAVAVGPGSLRWVLVAGAVLLPYVAVIMANAGTPRTTASASATTRPLWNPAASAEELDAKLTRGEVGIFRDLSCNTQLRDHSIPRL